MFRTGTAGGIGAPRPSRLAAGVQVRGRVRAGGAALVVAAGWLPWLHGENGFTVVNRLLALEPVVEGLAPRWLLLSWYALPLTAVVVWLTTWLAPEAALSLLGATAVLVVAWSITAVSIVRSGSAALAGPLVAAVGIGCIGWSSLAAVLDPNNKEPG